MTAFNFSLAALNGTALNGIRSGTLDRREQQSALSTDGTLHETTAAVIRAAPMARLSTLAVRALFSTLGTGDAVPFVALNGSTGLVMYGGLINSTGPGYTSGSAKIATALTGFVFLDSVRWSSQQPAEAEVSVYLTAAAGGTNPVTDSTGNLPTLPFNQEQLVLSALTINGTSAGRVRSFDLQIAHRCENNADESYQQGLPYPTQCAQAGVSGATEILLTIETLDLTTAFANGAVVITLTQLNHLGVGLDTETATITINGVMAREQTIQGESGSPASRQILIRGTFDGTNAPVTLATA